MIKIKSDIDAPIFIEPCLAELSSSPPEGDDWIHETKFDGYRLQARLAAGTVQLRTRSGLDWTDKFRSLASAFEGVPCHSALIDGEVVVEDARGVSDFGALASALKQGRSEQVVFFAFDLLFLNGKSLVANLLKDRKSMLQDLLKPMRPEGAIRFSKHIESQGNAMFTEACRLGLEGVVSKRIDKPYRSGRHGDWLKSKCVQSDEFIILGYVDSAASASAVGALVVGAYEEGRLIYGGRVGTGFSHKTATDLWDVLQKERITASVALKTLTPMQRRGVVWVRPILVAQIEYRGFTNDKLLRHAAFKALLEDKISQNVFFPTPNKF